MEIEKKVWPEYFQKILDGNKTFDLRLADFECNNGDILILKEWDQERQEYTGRVVQKEVSKVLKTSDMKLWPRRDIEKYGFQVISFK